MRFNMGTFVVCDLILVDDHVRRATFYIAYAYSNDAHVHRTGIAERASDDYWIPLGSQFLASMVGSWGVCDEAMARVERERWS